LEASAQVSADLQPVLQEVKTAIERLREKTGF